MENINEYNMTRRNSLTFNGRMFVNQFGFSSTVENSGRERTIRVKRIFQLFCALHYQLISF